MSISIRVNNILFESEDEEFVAAHTFLILEWEFTS